MVEYFLLVQFLLLIPSKNFMLVKWPGGEGRFLRWAGCAPGGFGGKPRLQLTSNNFEVFACAVLSQ